ncbi:hypothetical protein PANT_2d00031 [Moesziomyces antarcticus T-34]|uniref:N-acetyltransferase domain-containing protein n=1 Tax=Pseudozyma antarctica (strain T-34) TaxID=1151754 RepID=M9LWT1_PSEA3|nr:hypothetical protein PANT_2d00031 [Moesziomyces antarcticus T-34]
MSFEAESTLQEQMAGPSRPRFTGWLTMAPEVDPTPAPAAPSAQPTVETNNATASGSSSAQPVASTHGFGYLGQQIKLPQRKKRRATFQVGSPGLSEDEGGSASSSLSSHASSDAPDFDVRASFAPMPVYGKKPNAAPLSSYQGVGDQGQAGTVKQSGLHNRAVADTQAQQSSSDDEADGLSFGGRRWKGKTVHAVELELEALRDERLMSHAPDAAYLASRLEGVRRNLEIEERKPSYVPYDEDVLTDDEEVALAPDASDVVRQLYPFQHPHVGLGDAPPMPHRPVSNASSVSLVEGETPHDLDFGLQFEGSAPIGQASQEIKIHDPDEVAMPPLPAHLAPHSAKQIDPAARAAALDSRIEVRALRRGDLEQVRDLHAFHGDSDRSHPAQEAVSTVGRRSQARPPIGSSAEASPVTDAPSIKLLRSPWIWGQLSVFARSSSDSRRDLRLARSNAVGDFFFQHTVSALAPSLIGVGSLDRACAPHEVAKKSTQGFGEEACFFSWLAPTFSSPAALFFFDPFPALRPPLPAPRSWLGPRVLEIAAPRSSAIFRRRRRQGLANPSLAQRFADGPAMRLAPATSSDRTSLSPDHGETYTSTASFLLRLLVDDRHVCLVAVAKPIPEPAAPLPAAADLVGLAARRGEEADSLPGSPQSTSPASLSASDDEASTGLKSLQLDAARAAESSDQSSLSSSPGHGGRATTSSLFSAVGPGAGLVPTAPHTRMISPRGRDGRINNTPATSVFSDIFAERGATVHKPVLADLPGPTDMASAPVKKVMSIPPPRGADARAVEAETILGVVSAHLSVVAAPSEDHLWFGGGSGKKAVEDASALVDVHVLTLATAPEERGQGLGAKLLAALHAECMHKARHMAMRMRNPRAVPVVAPLSPRFIDESTLMASMGATGSKSPYLRGVVGCSLAQLRDSKPGGKYLARTFLEVHPSNMHAIALYRAHGFQAPADDTAAVKRGFYRGDTRIATAERTKRGGTDAWILQRFDGPIP